MTDHRSHTDLATKRELELARTRGQMVGWAQGAGAAVALWLGVGLLGLVPILVLGLAGAYLIYRALFKKER